MPRPWLAVALAVAAGTALCAAAGVSTQLLLCLAPALLLSSMLIARGYPGERLLLRAAARRRSHRPRAAAGVRPPGTVMLGRPRGGLLLAFELAVRPPPAALAAS